MASQTLKHRSRDDPNIITTTRNNKSTKNRRENNMAMAKRGLRSLAITVSIPLSLTLLTIYLTSTHSYVMVSKPSWFPPLWAIHITSLASSFLLGLSAWLVWAVGGFHQKPTALSLYLAQLGLSLVWHPIVLGSGASWVGLAVCLATFGALVGCFRICKEVNPTAGDIIAPCSAWTAFLAIVNLTLIFL
uniref:Translocator protein homolog n=2 Tax=Quercus lobata TaxID=97700 RepID=A0A7N2RES8_QUELO